MLRIADAPKYHMHVHVFSSLYDLSSWAARYNTWLLIKLTLKGVYVVFSSSFFASFLSMTYPWTLL